MPSYDLRRKNDRDTLRAERTAELAATQDGTWPRDLNDAMRWSPRHGSDPRREAARFCAHDLAWLDDLEARLAAGTAPDGYV